MDEKMRLIAKSFGENKVKFDENLSSHVALKVGGPAKLFAVAISEREIIKLVEECRFLKIPFLIIGTGSKMVISDQGYEGVIIKNRTQNIKIVSIKGQVSKNSIGVNSVLVEVEGGVSINQFIDFLNKQSLDTEGLVGLTGSIGGNLWSNRSLQDWVESIKVLNSETEIENLIFRNLNLSEHVILSVTFKVKTKK